MKTKGRTWRAGAIRWLAWVACAAALHGGPAEAAQPASAKAKAARKAPVSAGVVIKEVDSPSHKDILNNLAAQGDGVEVVFANAYGATCAGCPFTSIPRVNPADATAAIVAGGARQGNAPGGVTDAGQSGGAAAPDNLPGYPDALGAAAQNVIIVAPGGATARGRDGAETASGGGAAAANGVDSSTLGGMYPQKIRIMATPRGLGVRQPDDAAASAAGLRLTADGRILIAEPGAR